MCIQWTRVIYSVVVHDSLIHLFHNSTVRVMNSRCLVNVCLQYLTDKYRLLFCIVIIEEISYCFKKKENIENTCSGYILYTVFIECKIYIVNNAFCTIIISKWMIVLQLPAVVSSIVANTRDKAHMLWNIIDVSFLPHLKEHIMI